MSNRHRALKALMAAISHPRGAGGVMEDAEIAMGARLIPVGSERPIPLPAFAWRRGVVSMLGMEIRIVAIEAVEPGAGAFSRLIAEIQRRGFTPVVVEPFGVTMPAIMAKWDWKRRVVGSGFERREEWLPR